jgi:hypothetical protein
MKRPLISSFAAGAVCAVGRCLSAVTDFEPGGPPSGVSPPPRDPAAREHVS